MESCLKFERVSKRYRIGRGLANLRTLLGGNNGSRAGMYHWALKDVSFALQPGEALGIIGPNGAGKTTILKILSRVTHPTDGTMSVNGRLAGLIELGAGFHPDLTGRDNIYLNGTILGMRKEEIKARFDRIVDFAGIGAYLDTPVKRYSSGMYARLGFAVAAHVDPEILLVDEVLAVGDTAFQAKCHARMDELRKNGTSLIFVSHSMAAVRRVCDRGLVMYRGQVAFQGTAPEAVVAYSDAVRQAARDAELDVPDEGGISQRVMTFDAEIERVALVDEANRPVTVLQTGADALILIDVRFRKDVHEPIFSFYVRSCDGRLINNTTSRWMNVRTPDFTAGEHCRVEFKISLPLLAGEYELGVDITSSDLSHFYDRIERAMNFCVEGSNGSQGLVDFGTKINVVRLSSCEQVK